MTSAGRLAVEREVKLAYPSTEAARQAVETAGGRLVRSRRLLEDRLFDDDDDRLRARGTALRVRLDGERAFLTWKGPAVHGPVKAREELETEVKDVATLVAILTALGYRQRFRSQKFRAEYDRSGAIVTIDEAPFGVFVEIEGPEESIGAVAAALGRTPADYILESYPTLWLRWCREHGRPPGDMLFT